MRKKRCTVVLITQNRSESLKESVDYIIYLPIVSDKVENIDFMWNIVQLCTISKWFDFYVAKHEEEIEFAKQLQASVDSSIVSRSKNLYGQDNSMFMGVGNRDLWNSAFMTPSSDTGDVSFILPTGLFTTACWPMGCSPHTWQATSAAGMSLGEKGALYAAKVIAGCAYDIFNKKDILKKIQFEFGIKNDGSYKPMLSDDCIIK